MSADELICSRICFSETGKICTCCKRFPLLSCFPGNVQKCCPFHDIVMRRDPPEIKPKPTRYKSDRPLKKKP